MRDDFELLDAWRDGDARSGDALFKRHFEALFRFFSTKIADGIDDLIQQTLLGCVESRDRFDARSSFRTFMFAVAKRRLYDDLRRRHRTITEICVESISLADLGTSPSSAAARTEREARLIEACRKLPLDHQIALELAYWEGMTGPEIAEVLDVSPHTVRSRLARARKALSESLEASRDDEKNSS